MSEKVYAVKECFYSLQGEGANSGMPAVFCRFTGCNLWSGREEDRVAATCNFCDTDFVGTDGLGGGRFGASSLADHVLSFWGGAGDATVICTGGEPLLQLDAPLIRELKSRRCWIAVETNGTIRPPGGIDWLTVSPKESAPIAVQRGNELKLVFPQPQAPPERFAELAFDRFYLQPMDGPDIERNTALATEYCLTHPQWRLSLQIHKFLGLR